MHSNNIKYISFYDDTTNNYNGYHFKSSVCVLQIFLKIILRSLCLTYQTALISDYSYLTFAYKFVTCFEIKVTSLSVSVCICKVTTFSLILTNVFPFCGEEKCQFLLPNSLLNWNCSNISYLWEVYISSINPSWINFFLL